MRKEGPTVAECKRGDIVCFNSDKEGHLSSHCTKPKKTQTSGRVFALTGTQTDNEDRLIRGTCFFNSTPLIAIILELPIVSLQLIVHESWV